MTPRGRQSDGTAPAGDLRNFDAVDQSEAEKSIGKKKIWIILFFELLFAPAGGIPCSPLLSVDDKFKDFAAWDFLLPGNSL